MPPLSEEQHELRAQGIGSSEVAAVVGESPWATPSDIWLRKRGLRDADPENGRMWLGHVIEPALAAWYAEETGRAVDAFGRTVKHKTHSFALASPDFEVNGFDVGRRLLECKSVGWRSEHHWSRNAADGVPLYVLLQTQWQMGIVGAESCDVAVIFLSDGERLIYEIAFDAELFAQLLVIVGRFWKLVESGEPPAVDGSDASREILESIYGFHREPLKPAPPEAEDLFAQRIAVDELLKTGEAEKALVTNKLCELVGDAEGIEGMLGRFTWKTNKAGQRTARFTPFKAAKKAA